MITRIRRLQLILKKTLLTTGLLGTRINTDKGRSMTEFMDH